MNRNSGKKTYPPSPNDLKNDYWISIIDDFVKKGGDINSTLLESGGGAGYTTLHFHCLFKGNQKSRVSILIHHYKANVNSVGEDGAQPIHLACLLDNTDTVDILLKSGANVNAEITKELYEKYARGHKWTDDFGGKMTLLAWSIFNSRYRLTQVLLNQRGNLAIKDINEKTLLMHAFERNYVHIVNLTLSFMSSYPELINARDSRGLHALHYIFPNDRFEECRFYSSTFHEEFRNTVPKLFAAGADLNVTVNGDPDTLLLNMAAYRLNVDLFTQSLDFRIPLSKESRPLHYLTLPVKNSTKYWYPSEDIDDDDLIWHVKLKKEKCLNFVLKNFVVRRSLGWFVPEEEIKLMDRLVAEDTRIRTYVSDCEQNLIVKLLKGKVLHYGDKFITLHGIAEKTNNHRSMKLLVNDDNFIKAYGQFHGERSRDAKEIRNVVQAIGFQIIIAYQRKKLLETIKKIGNLMDAIPLPYEIILCIIDFVDDDSLNNLITAFNDAYFNDDNSYSEIYLSSFHNGNYSSYRDIFNQFLYMR